MTPDESARLAQLERQVAFLFRHLGLNPDLTGSAPGQPSTFGAPAGGPGARPSYGDGRPAAFAPPSFSSAPPASQPPSAPPVPVAGFVPGPPGCPPTVMAALQRGSMIAAIKIYRELTGMGLKEAKAAVEAFDRQRAGG